MRPQAFHKTHLLIQQSPSFLWWLMGNSCLAYAVNLTNFMVTKYTSALTLQVGWARPRQHGAVTLKQTPAGATDHVLE